MLWRGASGGYTSRILGFSQRVKQYSTSLLKLLLHLQSIID